MKSLGRILYLSILLIATSCEEPMPRLCGEEIYNIEHSEIILKSVNTSKIKVKPIDGAILKKFLGINTVVKHKEINKTVVREIRDGDNCGEINYNIIDVIKSIEITVTDVTTQQETVVTNNFTYYNKYGKLLDTEELIKASREKEPYSLDDYFEFNLQLVKFDNIPSSVLFTVKIFLDSGKIIMKKLITLLLKMNLRCNSNSVLK